jgi:hypothetical protein
MKLYGKLRRSSITGKQMIGLKLRLFYYEERFPEGRIGSTTDRGAVTGTEIQLLNRHQLWP